MGFFETKHILDGNRIEITGTRFEGATIVRLRKIAQNTDAYTGAVNIAVSAPARPDEEHSVFYHRVFFTLESEEEYRFAAPFDSTELLLVLQSERNTLYMRLNPD
jgi:hypothetical protein